MTTVGYGDYFAQTPLGRFVTFIMCIWGSFIVSMFVVTLSNTLQTSSFEAKSIVVIEKLNLKSQMKMVAGKVLTILARMG